MKSKRFIFVIISCCALLFSGVLFARLNKKYTTSIATLFYQKGYLAYVTIATGGSNNSIFTTMAGINTHIALFQGTFSYQLYGTTIPGGSKKVLYVTF